MSSRKGRRREREGRKIKAKNTKDTRVEYKKTKRGVNKRYVNKGYFFVGSHDENALYTWALVTPLDVFVENCD